APSGHVGRVRGCLGDRDGRRAGASATVPGTVTSRLNPARARRDGLGGATRRSTDDPADGDRGRPVGGGPSGSARRPGGARCDVPAHLRRAVARWWRIGASRGVIACARRRDLETEVVGGGPFAGEDLAMWDPIVLAGNDAELATTPLDLRILVPRPLAG